MRDEQLGEVEGRPGLGAYSGVMRLKVSLLHLERERKKDEPSRETRLKLGDAQPCILDARLPELARTVGQRGAGDIVTIMIENEDANGG
jgi:hypothetical protein